MLYMSQIITYGFQILSSLQDLFGCWLLDSVSFNIFNYFLLFKGEIKKVLSFSFFKPREERLYFSIPSYSRKQWHLHYNRLCLWLGTQYKYIVFISTFNYALLWNIFIIKFVYYIHKLFLYCNNICKQSNYCL